MRLHSGEISPTLQRRLAKHRKPEPSYEMTQQSDDLAMLSRAFEDTLTELLLEVLMEGGTSFDRQMKLRLARNRLRRHKDFTEKEYQAAVLRAARRALPSE